MVLVYLGIDVGGSSIKYALLRDNAFVFKKKVPTPPRDYQLFLATLREIVAECGPSSLRGVGVCVPGKVDDQTGLVEYGGALPYLHRKNLVEEIQRFADVPVFVDNDAKAAVRGEAFSGNLQGVEQGAVIVLGTGVGSGYILDGKLRRGLNHQSGEVSSAIQDRDNAGKESFVAGQCSAVGLIRDLADILGVEPNGPLVFSLLDTNAEAVEHLRLYGRRVGLLIYNLQTVLDLQRYVIAGGISTQPQVIEAINEGHDAIRATDPPITETLQRPEIMAAKYRSDANLVGVVSCFLPERTPITINCK